MIESVDAAVNAAGEFFGERVQLARTLYEGYNKENYINAVYKIKVKERYYILKIKEGRGYSDHRKNLVQLVGKNVKIPQIIYEGKGIVIKEYMDGVTLGTLLSKHRYSRVKKDLNQIYFDLGEYLGKLHSTRIPKSIGRAGIMPELIDKLEQSDLKSEHKKVLEKEIGTLGVLSRPCIIHGDFYNMNNIMVEKIDNTYKLKGLIDYDNMKIWNKGTDLSKILGSIVIKSEDNYNNFVKGYTNYVENNDIDNLKKDIKAGHIEDIIILSHSMKYNEPSVEKHVNNLILDIKNGEYKPLKYFK